MNKKIKYTGLIAIAIAIKKMYKNFELIGFNIEQEKCYIDLKSSEIISESNFKEIEKTIKKIVGSGAKIKQTIQNDKKNLCEVGSFSILIDGNLEESLSKIKYFKLLQIGGLSNNEVRIHFCVFENKVNFDNYMVHLDELSQRDHRKIGKELEIFCFSDSVGQGLPMFLPNGAFLKDKISYYLKSICQKNDFKLVSTPILGSKELYVTSGHWDLYKENNFPPIKIDDEFYMLRPMTCPHHMMIFKYKPRSYKELPLFLCEDSILHRYESSGGLIGLERVRSMELFDSHIFCNKNQIQEVILKLYGMIQEVYEKLNIKIDRIDLSLRSDEKDKFFNDKKMWDDAEFELKKTLDIMNVKYQSVKGEAAFYGPKIDFQYKTIHEKYITISTIQLDFLLPKKFELTYKNENGENNTPIIIHLGLIGTYERFISCLLSQTKGILPLWLVQNQVVVIPVNNDLHLDYSKKIIVELRDKNINALLNDSKDRMSKKIRNAQISKVPFQIIIGDDEVKNQKISYRKYGEQNTINATLVEFVKEFN